MALVYTISKSDLEKIENNFTYHAPIDGQPERYESIRNMAKALALEISRKCPASRERGLAMTNLEQAMMWANAAIARNEPNNQAKEVTDVQVSE